MRDSHRMNDIYFVKGSHGMIEEEEDGWRWLYPQTVEDVLLAIGRQELGVGIHVVFTHELMADIAVRLIRLEDAERKRRD